VAEFDPIDPGLATVTQRLRARAQAAPAQAAYTFLHEDGRAASIDASSSTRASSSPHDSSSARVRCCCTRRGWNSSSRILPACARA
jgi:hypothetical protein